MKFNLDGHKLMYHPDRVSQFLQTGDCYPLYMEISLVGSCNHRCVFCAYDYIGHPGRKLETARLKQIVDELGECGLKSVLFAGEGEPLIHPDVTTLVSHAASAGIDCGMFTNGQLLNEGRLHELLPALQFMRFSFSGGTPESYSEIHAVKPHVFDVVVRNIQTAVKTRAELGSKVTLGAQFVVLRENLKSIVPAVQVLRELGIDYIVFKPFVQQSEQQFYQQGTPLTLEELEPVFSEAESLKTDTFSVIIRRSAFSGYGQRSYGHCYGCNFITVLNSAGDFASCLPYWDKKEFVYGNMYQQTFKEIWNGERRKEIKQLVEERLAVGQCPPNCRPHAINGYLYEIRRPSVAHLNFI